MYKKCLTNRITRNGKDYKCYLCHQVMKDSCFDVIKEHLLSEKHQERLNQIDKEKREVELQQLLHLKGPERKRIVDNQITIDRSSLNFNCHVCKCPISGLFNILQHIDGYTHNKNYKNFVEQIDKAYETKAKINTSDKITTDKKTVTNSVSFQLPMPALQSGSNGITNDPNNSRNVSQHKQGFIHQCFESKLKNPPSVLNSEYIIYNVASHSYQCILCNCKLMDEKNVGHHINGLRHLTMLSSQKLVKTKPAESRSLGLINQTIFKSHQANELDKTIQDKILKPIHLQFDYTEESYCNSCKIIINDNTVLKCHILLHLYEEFDLLKNFDLIQFELKPNQKIYLECLLCNSFICESLITHADQELAKHLKTDIHLGYLTLFNFFKCDAVQAMNDQLSDIGLENSKYQPKMKISIQSLCNICKVPVGLNNQEEHAAGKTHSKNVLKNGLCNTNVENKTECITKDYYACFICNTSFSESSKLLEHLKRPEHQWKIIALNMINKCSYMKFTKRKEQYVISCLSCNTYMYNCKSAMDHMLGKKHKEELKLPSDYLKNEDYSKTALLDQVANKFENLSVKFEGVPRKLGSSSNSMENKNVVTLKTKNLQKIKKARQFEASSIEELNELGFDTENVLPQSTLEPDMVNKTLDSLVQLNFSNSQIKRLPFTTKPKLPRTPKVEGHRKSFATNVLLNGKNFVKYCIDPGLANIYNSDDHKINLLKLGVTLTFPYYSDRVCIPCAQQFPDNVQSLFEHLKKQEHLKIISDMQVNDEEFKHCPEQFSDLKLAKLYMYSSDLSIKCHACDIGIEDKDDIIRQHAEEPEHKARSRLWKEESDQLFNQYLTIYKDIWYYAEVFFCEVCKKRCEFEIDFAMHLINLEHMKKVYELKFKGTTLTFDLCPSCITYWFGKTDSYELHCQSTFHKRFVTNKDFMVPNLTITATEYLDNIDINAELLVSESNKANLEKDKESELLKAIVETVKPLYPDAEAYIFGSRLSHLGFPDSDADVFLDCGNVYCASSTKDQSQEYVKSVKAYFESTSNIWIIEEVLLASRIPIIKMRHIPTNLKCDISFTNGLSVEKSSLIGLYNNAFPICRKLILFMKKWLTFCRIFGSDYITTFAISWCIIFYLQLQGIFPSVDELIKRKMESKIVDGWECGFDKMVTARSSNLSFKDHLKGFFTYFANFDYQKSVICPYLGKTIDKRAFAYTDELPAEMDIYKRRLNNNEEDIFRFDSPMCVQDPIDLSQNITKAVKKQQLRRFRQYCMLSAAKC